MQDPFAAAYLTDVRHRFTSLKELADKAVARVTDQELFTTLDPGSNSIALLIKHLAGNMRVRWRVPYSSDGEADRDRDSEFVVQESDTRSTILEHWESAWQCLFDTLASLAPDELQRTVVVRSRPYTMMQAINRQLTHYAMHVGQIVFLAKHLQGSTWESLSLPRAKQVEPDR